MTIIRIEEETKDGPRRPILHLSASPYRSHVQASNRVGPEHFWHDLKDDALTAASRFSAIELA